MDFFSFLHCLSSREHFFNTSLCENISNEILIFTRNVRSFDWPGCCQVNRYKSVLIFQLDMPSCMISKFSTRMRLTFSQYFIFSLSFLDEKNPVISTLWHYLYAKIYENYRYFPGQAFDMHKKSFIMIYL